MGWEPEYSFDPEFKLIQGANYAMHFDLAINGDRAGAAMSHVAHWETRTVDMPLEEGGFTQQQEVVPIVRNDFTIAWTADASARLNDEAELGSLPREIQMRWARELVFKLQQLGFYIMLVTFDGFQ